MRRARPAFVLLLALLLAACSGRGPAGPPEPQQIDVVVGDFSFEPAHLEVDAGRPVVVEARNEGNVEHDWVLQDPDASELARIVLLPGEVGEARFTVERGEYHVSCTMEGHWELGMRGTLTAR